MHRTEPAAPSVPTVLKIGGHELQPGPSLEAVVAEVRRARSAGHPVVLVHGGGEEVTHRAQALGLESTIVRGQRVTSAPMLEIVIEVLAGRVNGRLVAALGAAGLPALGISGADDRTLGVRAVPGLGFVGEPTRVRPALLTALLGAGYLPVVAPIGVDRTGQRYNVNADLAAGAIANALDAPLLLLTDVPAVRGPDGGPVGALTPAGARELLRDGTARGGMIPKLAAAERVARENAAGVWIGALAGLDGLRPRPGHGTWVRRAAAPAERPPLAAPARRAGP